MSLIGSFTWEPTFSAAIRLITRLWPEIRRRVPEARLQVVGWGARRALAEFLNVDGVMIEEDVPDTAPYFESTDVLLYAPNSASGMKVKVLEAFAYGVAVVTNADGVEGIPARDGVHAGIAEDDEGLITRTVSLLTSPDERSVSAGCSRPEAECSPGWWEDGGRLPRCSVYDAHQSDSFTTLQQQQTEKG